ncbi:TPA: phage portal protein [Photobacterium damselae]
MSWWWPFGGDENNSDNTDIESNDAEINNRTAEDAVLDLLGNPNVNVNAMFGGLFGEVNGEKAEGTFGLTYDFDNLDYYQLRERSLSLYYTNPYVRGIINRLITNTVGAGLKPESQPLSEILKIDDKKLVKWTEHAESLFHVYANSKVADYFGEETLNQLQLKLELNCLLCGDVLVIERMTEQGLPTYEFIDGNFVSAPVECEIEDGNKIEYGVEFTANKKRIAYWIESSDGEHKRIPAYSDSGRMQAWLAYGSVRRFGEIRGYPILLACLQALKQIDRYTDSELTAAEINATIAGFVKQTAKNGRADSPFGGGVKGSRRAESIPAIASSFERSGVWIQGLREGEEPTSYNTQRPNVNYAGFVRAILSGVSFSLDIPPEILFLEFDSSYSAARQVNNEFTMSITEFQRPRIISNLVKPAWNTVVIYQTLAGKLNTPLLVDSIKNPNKWDVLGAWLNCEWIGPHRKPIDPDKESKANVRSVDRGWKTNQQSSLEISGNRFSNNVNRIKGENEISRGVINPESNNTNQQNSNKQNNEGDDE